MFQILYLISRELTHRWATAIVSVLVIVGISGTLTFVRVNNTGLQKEIARNVRDIGSNVVILPAAVNQVSYHANGGYAQETMSNQVLQQIVEYRASLNHLIPMLERKTDVSLGVTTVMARVVGIAASIPMPGRPKAPMQKAVPVDKVQLGSQLAESLGVSRDDHPSVLIGDREFLVDRVNRSTGTWQDGAVLMDLDAAQSLFGLPDQISRIEAIECASEQCANTGQTPQVVLAHELARITDQAALLRRKKIADARTGIRQLSHQNARLLQDALWVFLAAAVVGLACLNAFQRRPEIGVLHALGYPPQRIVLLFAGRWILIAVAGAAIGGLFGAGMAYYRRGLFVETGDKFAIDWMAAVVAGVVTVAISAVAACLPAIWSVGRPPADIIGNDF